MADSPTLKGKSELTFDTKSSDMQRILRSNGIYDRFQMDWFNKFTRFGMIDPYNTLTGTREYLFFTKPDLCIFNSNGNLSRVLSNSAFFTDVARRYKPVLEQLQLSYSIRSPFMSILSNAVTSTLDMPSVNASMIEGPANIMGTKISYRGTSIHSDEDGQSFSLEFEDDKYLDVYMLFKAYDEYEKLKWRGGIDFENAESDRWKNYIINKVLHDQISIYKFVVADDGESLIYWARYTGCTPVDIPREAFTDMKDSLQQKLTVGWHGHFVRDMDPIIITQFNSLVKSAISGRYNLPLYDTDNLLMNGEWATMPYIEIKNINDSRRRENNRRDYFLKWVK